MMVSIVGSMGDSRLIELTDTLNRGEDLDSSQIIWAVEALTASSDDMHEKMAFLEALHEKGESVAEVSVFANTFRERALKPAPEVLEIAASGLDFVGTGGDHSNAFNISTSVCMILAANGVPILKHGNRGATTASGTADMQEALGFKAPLEPDAFLKVLKERNFGFFFAPAYHPAFKHIVPVRKELAAKGKRTLFNILGPLINPAQPAFQVLGVYDRKWVEPLAGALTRLGRKRGVVIHSETSDGRSVDKAITAGKTFYCGVGELEGVSGEWLPEDFGFTACDFSRLTSGTPVENAARLLEIFEGGQPEGLFDTLCLNAAIGLWVTGAASDIQSGISQVQELLASGHALAWLKESQKLFAEM